MPNLYETLIGAPPSGPEETAQVARQLRGRQQLGELGILTGDNVLSPLGQSMIKGVQEKTKGLQQTRQKKIETDRLLAQQAELTDYRGVTSAERERHNRAMEKLRDEQTKAAASKLANKIPPSTVQRDARSMVDSSLYTSQLLDNFKDEYGSGMLGVVGGGTVARFIGGTALGDADDQAMAQWWKSYDRLYTLPTRNKMFGSALTEHEKAAWEAANISANSPPELIRKVLGELSKIAADASARMEGDLRTIYSNEWVDEAFKTSTADNPRPSVDETAEDVVTSSQGFTYTVNP